MRVKKLKAYEARNKWGYRDYATVVFAESAGKARAIALYTEACEGSDFTDIEVFRVPQLDKYYKPGKQEMDWFDEKDRIALVKYGGFYCSREVIDPSCENCPASKWCDRYKDERSEV